MSIVVALLMLTYVAIPSRLIGMKSTYSARDQLSATVIGSAMGAVVCSPAYMLGRVGLVMLGSKRLFVFGVLVLIIGFGLQAGAAGAVKAVTVSAKLVAGRQVDDDHPSDHHDHPSGHVDQRDHHHDRAPGDDDHLPR